MSVEPPRPTPSSQLAIVMRCSMFGSLLLGTSAFFWSLMDLFTPFLAPFLVLGVWACFGCIFGYAGIYALFTWCTHRSRVLVPLLINGIALVLALNGR